MKNTVQTPSVPASAAAAERFALRVTARLSGGIDELPYEISERLRAARVQALARRLPVAPAWRTAPADTIVHAGGYATLGRGGWWGALVSAVPLLALVVGLVFINMAQDECSAHDVAEVDAALLTDDLPPAAYADQGFVQFLKTSAQLD
ncbi:DUF3619 family protein [Verminephrobacter aporrectodeae]|uniref:DUF3619 family protein n=1 Tax=Verminephrobacter aporrectodeae subsp. tuberculatae TaxID=1110392 RepID=A0ABT3KUM1_9BURK|nr:DUF3619 family protein [Verminephrobacter aporrectodeae]MCW5222993.1 DUF3619 family protein [Verminephrobacter aporrectodeae subsp. tuberculatae]MCW5256791.1 DUF3619 family protein [Verminephrobacter aporrectodeae subsp. tuberculatae]MCW5288457.1 DUF3619 family protein [Verminephrobacter aporrectodeae subsp. tuberculatae]MCW5322038.1 DUF3619 family protein [Verminephrobacter aporrectodeae subsp. tuberculatae]MCW8164400.1 DUF3619 family protein [Verminephrobacter aporrectodeae subsp. tubercu